MAHNDVLERSVELVSSAGKEVSPVHTDHHVVEYDDVRSSSPVGPLIVIVMATNIEERSQVVSANLVQMWSLIVWCRQHMKAFTVIREFSMPWSYVIVFLSMIKSQLNCHSFRF